MSALSSAHRHTRGVDVEPSIVDMLDGALAQREKPAYSSVSEAELEPRVIAFLENQGVKSPKIVGLKRMGGGASKEQFVFELQCDGAEPQKCVLRLDPLESAVVSDRRKEFSVMQRMLNVLPVPPVLWADFDGEQLGRPALITGFIGGITKPATDSGNVSGLGTLMPEAYREPLSKQFMKYLEAMHAVPVDFDTEVFQVPNQDPFQAARWQVNWWTSAWRDDASEGSPLMGLAERWMRDNLPETGDLVVVHADYRTGNYLFDDASKEITTILDWELAHIGDFHEDLAWIICHKGVTDEGQVMASGLMTPEELCQRYTEMTGREVNQKALHFYRVLSVYKCVVICLATSAQTAGRKHSHQDILLSWLTSAGHAFSAELAALLEESL